MVDTLIPHSKLADPPWPDESLTHDWPPAHNLVEPVSGLAATRCGNRRIHQPVGRSHTRTLAWPVACLAAIQPNAMEGPTLAPAPG
jgi:hypothetical protein